MALRTAAARPAAPAGPAVRRGPILALFIASGAAGLIYQVVWSRELVLVFGNTTQAVSTIVTAFLACLGLGGLVGGRLADSSRRPLRLYGILELGIATCGLLLPFVFGRLGDAYRGFYPGLVEAPVRLTAVRFLLAFLAVVQLVAVPAFALLLLGPSVWPALPELIGVLALADVGMAVVGTVVSALAVQTAARDLIAPLISLPLMIPLLIAAARATTPLLLAGGAGPVPLRWVAILGLYDAVFALLAYAVFDFLVED